MDRIVGVWLLALVLSVSCVAGQAPLTDEDLPGWSEFERCKDIFGTFEEYNRTQLHLALDAMDSITIATRESCVSDMLAHVRGAAPQKVRLLLWLRETEPAIRTELLLQWLSERKSLPREEWTKKTLRGLLPGRREEAIRQRLSEIEEAYELLPARRAAVQSNQAAFKYSVDEYGGGVVDRLSEEILLSSDHRERARIYQ